MKTSLLTILLCAIALTLHAAEKPNILVILADDLGYGDVSCFHPQSKLQTPHLDKLAAQGAKFTDAHSPTAVCTPTRYAMLTGRYSWRTRLGRGVLLGFEDPLIAADRLTVPAMLKKHGYHTACIGKWHLGWDWQVPQGQLPLFEPKKGDPLEVTAAHREAWAAYFAKPIAGGPITRGFDTYFGTDVPNLPPYGFIENDRLLGQPHSIKKAGDVTNIGHITTTGPAGVITADWRFDEILPTLVKKATRHIAERAQTKEPFFLYLPLTSPHFPVVPSKPFLGKSGLGDLGDFILETDDAVGQIMVALEEAGIAENTLVIFTSDNGPAPNSRTPLAEQGHDGSGGLRGHKGSVYEGGHRVPFIARWPGKLPAGTTISEPITHACLLATCAELLGEKLPTNAGEDSFSILPLLRGEKPATPTHPLLIHDSGASVFAIREGPWKLLFRPDGGLELYNLETDLAEKTNLAEKKPILVRQLTAKAKKAITTGRTTPGEPQKNDRIVKLNDPKAPLNE
jgi:arylsulfatase A-like enzyme